jgi:hypothetical protein
MNPVEDMPPPPPLPSEEQMLVCESFESPTPLTATTAATKTIDCVHEGCTRTFKKRSNFHDHFVRHHTPKTSPEYMAWITHTNKVQAAGRKKRFKTDKAYAKAEKDRSQGNRDRKKIKKGIENGTAFVFEGKVIFTSAHDKRRKKR